MDDDARLGPVRLDADLWDGDEVLLPEELPEPLVEP